MFADFLQFVVRGGAYVLLLFGLLYLAMRYFEGQQTPREHKRTAALLVAPIAAMQVVYQFLPLWLEVWPALPVFGHYFSIWTLLIFVLVFMTLWKGLSLDLKRAAFYVALFFVLLFIANHLYSTVSALLPPYSSYQPEKKFAQALTKLGVLSIPVAVWALSKFLEFRIPVPLACFGIALLYSPVFIIGHGATAVVSSLWVLLYLPFAGGSRLTGEITFMFFSATVSVGASTVVLVLLYHFAQRFRIPATEQDSSST